MSSRHMLKNLTAQTMNPRVLSAEYAVRGRLVLEAMQLQHQLTQNPASLPFDRIIECNIGNPQALGQKPITFHRQVLALMNVPELLEHPDVSTLYPTDAIARAKSYLAALPGGTGAYSHSKGVPVFREQVAEFLARRDGGHETNVEDIFLTDGASQGVQAILQCLIRNAEDGILVPIPQYPLYSACIALHGGTLVGYELDEDSRWSTVGLEAVLRQEVGSTQVRALVVINPGNPTGQCLTRESMEELVAFCEHHKLVLLADEVYQENVYATDRTFLSFKKVVRDLESNVELVSFHSTSKGFVGECGRRGGYMELTNICESAKEQLYKLASISLCSNIEGQAMVALMTNPPQPGDVSYDRYCAERHDILSSLKRRAVKLVAAYNDLEGVTCNPTDGALYTFPQIRLPLAAVNAAEAQGMTPDTLYCLEMLRETGVVVVPGSGFGQRDGTYHFRSTILPPEDQIDQVIEKTTVFHRAFLQRYSDKV